MKISFGDIKIKVEYVVTREARSQRVKDIEAQAGIELKQYAKELGHDGIFDIHHRWEYVDCSLPMLLPWQQDVFDHVGINRANFYPDGVWILYSTARTITTRS